MEETYPEWQNLIDTEIDKNGLVFKSYGSTGASPVKGQDDDEETRASLMQGKTENWDFSA